MNKYGSSLNFWTKKGDRCLTLGDILGRMSAIKLINSSKNEKILDAGCGAGFIARAEARAGARVWGCDSDKGMIFQAMKEERERSLGIRYMEANITQLPYSNKFFNTVSCIAVLMHLSPVECNKFFIEAHRVLRNNGKIVLSITHPDLYYTHREKHYWVNFSPLKKDCKSESQEFKEVYKDKEGDEFVVNVWRHPKKFLQHSIKEAGFSVEHTQSKFITEKALVECNQKGVIGSPCFFQLIARK